MNTPELDLVNLESVAKFELARADIPMLVHPSTVLALIAQARAGKELAEGLRVASNNHQSEALSGIARCHLLPVYDSAVKP